MFPFSLSYWVSSSFFSSVECDENRSSSSSGSSLTGPSSCSSCSISCATSSTWSSSSSIFSASILPTSGMLSDKQRVAEMVSRNSKTLFGERKRKFALESINYSTFTLRRTISLFRGIINVIVFLHFAILPYKNRTCFYFCNLILNIFFSYFLDVVPFKI